MGAELGSSDQAPLLPVSGFGVDTIGFSFPVPRQSFEHLAERRVRTSVDAATGELGEHVLGGHIGFHLRGASVNAFASSRGGFPRIRMEFSAAKVAQGHNVAPLPISSVGEVVEEVAALLRQELPVTPDVAAMNICRLDLARDFVDLDAPRRTLASLAMSCRPDTPRHRQEYNRAGELTYLLMGTSTRWKVRAYDKESEVRDNGSRFPAHAGAPPHLVEQARGRLRYELELRASLLRDRGITRLADVTNAEVDMFALARGYFVRCHLAETYAGASRVRQVLTDTQALTAAEQRNMLATLAAEHLGMSPPCGKNQAATARRLLRSHGLGAASLATDGPAHRLDFERGREVPC